MGAKRAFAKLANGWRMYGSILLFLVTVLFTSAFDVGCPPPNATPLPIGKFDRRFYEGGAGTNGVIRAVVEHPSGMIFIGGEFSQVANHEAFNIAVYDPVENSIHPLANKGIDSGDFGGNQLSSKVSALAIAGNYLYVGGLFYQTADGELSTLTHIARYKIRPDNPNDPDEQRWFPLAEDGVNKPVAALAVRGDKLFVGLDGSEPPQFGGGHAAHGFAIYQLDTGSWRPVRGDGVAQGNGSEAQVTAMAVDGDDVYVGGDFVKPFSETGPLMTRIGRYHVGNTPASDIWHSLQSFGTDTGLNGNVLSMAIKDSDYLFVGGLFTQSTGTGSTALGRIARYKIFATPSENAWLGLANQGLNGRVKDIEVSGNKLFVGGSFSSTGDNTVFPANIASYDLGTNQWSLLDGGGLLNTGGLDTEVNAIAISNNSFLYAGGAFRITADGLNQALNGFVGYSLSASRQASKTSVKTGALGGWAKLGNHNGKALNNIITGLAADASGKIYACGSFTETHDGSVTGLNFIAQYDPVTATWSPLANGGLNASVSSVAVDGNNLYVGGSFTRTADNTVILNRIARYDLTTNTWSALPGNGLNGSGVSGVAISGSNLFVTGDFSRTTTSSVINLNRIARFNTTTNVWTPLADNGLNGTVVSLAVSGNDLFAGGFFSQTFGGATTNLNFIARYNIATNIWSPLTGNGLNDSVKLAIFGDSLYMRGNFTQTFDGSIMLNKRAYYNTSTSAWSPVTGSQNDLDRAILANVMLRVGNELYIAGSFSEMGDAPAVYLTRIYLQQWNVPATSSDWFDNANWSTGTAPAANSNAVIPVGAGNINIAVADVVMNDLNVNGGTLNIAQGRTLTINGILSLSGGIITGGGTVVITSCLPDGIMGGERFAYIQTTLVRCVNNSDPFIFPVGTANGYSPVIVRDIVGSGNVSVKANQGAYSNPASGLPVNRLSRWWQIENPGGGVTSSNVIFGYKDTDISGVEVGYRAYRISGGNAGLITSTVNEYSNRVTATGVTGFSDWTLAQGVSTAAGVSLSGRVITAEGRGITNAVMTITDQNGNQRTALTGRFGTFRFDGLTPGETYVLSVRSRRFSFETPTQIVSLVDNLDNVDFVASLPQVRSKAVRINYRTFRLVR
ncbi:MAG: carboxypeptidase regulatory-like domain-containing protein [Pyrinomonadaceae bacterium]